MNLPWSFETIAWVGPDEVTYGAGHIITKLEEEQSEKTLCGRVYDQQEADLLDFDQDQLCLICVRGYQRIMVSHHTGLRK